jgi:hypothetical protein
MPTGAVRQQSGRCDDECGEKSGKHNSNTSHLGGRVPGECDAEAMSSIDTQTRSWLKQHPGGTATVTNWRFGRLANVVVCLPSARANARRVSAAVVELAKIT